MTPGYTEAYKELMQLVADLERGDIPVDELSEKVKRATQLIRICKEKLKTTEEDVSRILKDLEG